MTNIRRCRDDFTAILNIINAAAEAYRDAIPPDRWHEPYMESAQLHRELAAGVEFWGVESDGELIAVMGLQAVAEVDLIRHAYVLPSQQRRGVGAELMRHLRRQSTRRLLVGTWAAAGWAIDFYRRQGFELVVPAEAARLLRTYWNIPDRQIETSVVLEVAAR